MNPIWIIFASIAMLANAGSNLFQRKANVRSRRSLRSLSGLKKLITSPFWLGGFICLLISLITQVAALALGSLAGVETLLVLELPVAVLGGAAFFGTRLRKREWTSLFLMTFSTILLIVSLSPKETHQDQISPTIWLIGICLSAIWIIVPLLISLKVKRDLLAAALRGIATGVAFALAAAFAKGMTLAYHHGGIPHLLLSWEPYAALFMSLTAIWLLQFALRSGKLVATQPGITLANPYVSIVWGTLAFHEQIRASGLWLGLAGISLLVLSASVILMASSPAMSAE